MSRLWRSSRGNRCASCHWSSSLRRPSRKLIGFARLRLRATYFRASLPTLSRLSEPRPLDQNKRHYCRRSWYTTRGYTHAGCWRRCHRSPRMRVLMPRFFRCMLLHWFHMHSAGRRHRSERSYTVQPRPSATLIHSCRLTLQTGAMRDAAVLGSRLILIA